MHLSSVAALVSLLCLGSLFPAAIVAERAVTDCLRDTDKDNRPRLNCTAAGFRRVPPGIEPSTKVLLFPGNQLSDMSWRSFTVFTKIYEIDLTENKISTLSPSNAPNLPSLGVLHLGSNYLKAVPGLWFSGTPALIELYLQHNLINSLQDQSFSGLSKLEILDLSNNHIQTLPPHMMHPLTAIETLYLEGNKIKVLPDNWFSQKEEVPYLFLSENPWACSCSLGYLRRYLEEYEMNVYVRDGPIISSDIDSVICDSPRSLKGQSVIKLDESDLCNDETEPVFETTPLWTPPPLITEIWTYYVTETYHAVVTRYEAGPGEWFRGDGRMVKKTTTPSTTELPTTTFTFPTTTQQTSTKLTTFPTTTQQTSTKLTTFPTTTQQTSTKLTTFPTTTQQTSTKLTTFPTTTQQTSTKLTTFPTTTQQTSTKLTTFPTTTQQTSTKLTTFPTTTQQTSTKLTTFPTTTQQNPEASPTFLSLETVKMKTTDATRDVSCEFSDNKNSASASSLETRTVFCFWLFIGCIFLCVILAISSLITALRLYFWYRGVYKSLKCIIAGKKQLRMVTYYGNVDDQQARYRTMLLVSKDNECFVSLGPKDNTEVANNVETAVYKQSMYRVISKEEEIEARDVLAECKASREANEGASKKRYSVILREVSEKDGGGTEKCDWVVGGWEVEKGAGPGSSWGEWLGQILPSVPWGVSAPSKSEAEPETCLVNERGEK